MPKIKNFSEIVNNMIERLRISQPNLDTKVGSVSRDVFIDLTADELQKLYSLISIVSNKQSFATATGTDLDLLAKNFGIIRNSGSLASGLVVFTASDLITDVSIPEGTEVSTRSGITFRTIGSYVMTPTQKNIYSSNASRIRSALNKVGNSDTYAIEVPVQASTRGESGNVSSFQINQNGGPLELNVINTQSISGGNNSENDSSFRARIFSLFNGSNTGTGIGYRNAAIGTSGVIDALVVEPGSSLMLRDGSEVMQSDDGNLSVINSGTGGKVDLYILGSSLVQVSESFVFRNKSSTDDISDEKNDLILGYANQDLLKTNLQRRLDSFKNRTFPLQPVESVVSVSGSISGLLTEEGSENANFRLVKDLNPDTGGSPFGRDKIKFISNKKVVSQERVSKSETISGDNIEFFNVNEFDNVYQDIFLPGETATVDSFDSSKISLRNYPIVSINNIKNVNTGESYSFSNANFENGVNYTGDIFISGNKLPSKGERVVVSYTARFEFDKNINFQSSNNFYLNNKNISDKIYWGSNDYIESEVSEMLRNDDDSNYILNISENIEDVMCVYTLNEESSLEIDQDDFGLFVDLSSSIRNIHDIKSSSGVSIFINIENSYTYKGMRLYIPDGIIVSKGDLISVSYNKTDYFNLTSSSGSFFDSTIVLPSDQSLESEGLLFEVESLFNVGSEVYIDYISKKEEMVSNLEMSSMPISGSNESNFLFSSDLSIIDNSYNPVDFLFSDSEGTSVLRNSPCRIKCSINSSFPNGIVRVRGSSLTKITAEIQGSYFDGKTFDLSRAIKLFLNSDIIPPTVRVAKVSSVILEDTAMDIVGYSISNNILDSKISVSDTSISDSSFSVPDTKKNNDVVFSNGSIFTVEFYLEKIDDLEDITFIESGDKYTSKVFSRISKVEIVSGFRNQLGAVEGFVSLSRFDKPSNGSNYFVDYNFKSPIDGERISVNYTINRLIIDVSQNIESVRTITSDVLVKEAQSISVDCEIHIVTSDEVTESDIVISENVQNQVTNTINSNTLGGSISISEIVSSASSISGVEGVSVKKFTDSEGVVKKSFIKSLDNQVIIPGSIVVNVVSRRNFN